MLLKKLIIRGLYSYTQLDICAGTQNACESDDINYDQELHIEQKKLPSYIRYIRMQL